MTSTNDGKEVKSNQTNSQKGKTYYIALYKSLDSRLCGDCTGVARAQCVCEAWRRIHSLCSHCAPATHPHLLSWLQRHTASTVLQTEWTKCEDQHALLAKAIDAFLEDCSAAISNRNGVAKYWEQQLQTRAHWFKSILPNPWGHSVLKALLDSEQSPSDGQILEWLKEERGVMFVTRLRQMAALKSCVDLALRLATAVMQRSRLCTRRIPDTEQIESQKEPAEQVSEDSFAGILSNEAGFTPEIWEFLTDLEFVLLHKATQRSTCIDLAKQVPLRNACQLVERLQNRPNISPAEKKLWKNAKEVALLIAQVVITRCMVVPTCRGAVLMALYGCSRSIVRLMTEEQLSAASVALAAPAATAHHLHTMAAAVHKQLQGERTQFTCQLYVRAITAGMNELEKLKLDKNKSAEARFSEKTLSTWFKNLGTLLCRSSRLKYECILTAFSVHPSPGMYEEVKNAPHLEPIKDLQEPNHESTSEFGSWATDSRTQTNFVKTSETLNIKKTQKQANVLSTAIFSEGESLELGSELCNDLAVLLSGPRVKTLTWDMEREALLDNCRTYMKKTDFGTRALSTELKYLNLDPRSFQHLPEEDENEDDLYYGIEKGYEHLVELQEPITDTIAPEIWQNVFYESPSPSSDDSITRRPKKERKKKKKKKVISNLTEDPLKLDSDIDAITSSDTLEVRKETQENQDRIEDANKNNDDEVDTETKAKKGIKKGRREKKLKYTDDMGQEPKKDIVKKTALRKFLSMKVARKNSDLRRLIANTERMMFPARGAECRDKMFNTAERTGVVSHVPEKSEVVFDGVFSLDDMSFQETKNQDIRLMGATVKDKTLLTQPITTEVTRTKNIVSAVTADMKSNIKKLISFRRNNFDQKGSSIKTMSVIKSPVQLEDAMSLPNDRLHELHNCSTPRSDDAEFKLNATPNNNTSNSIYKTPGQRAYENFVNSYETNFLNSHLPSQPFTSSGERQFQEFLKRYNNDCSTTTSEPMQSLKNNNLSHISEDNGLKYQPRDNKPNCGASESYTHSAPSNVHSTIVNDPTQRQIKEFLKELQDSINPAVMSNEKFETKDVNASVYSKLVKAPKKAENVPKTFARLSYLHKNKQSENKLKLEEENKTNNLPNVNRDLHSMLPPHLQRKGQIQLSRINKRSNVTDLILQGNEKVSKHQNPTNTFQADDSNLKTRCNEMIFQDVTKTQTSATTMLCEKDQTELLQLLKQKSKLNWSNAVMNPLPKSGAADPVTHTATWVNNSNMIAVPTAKLDSAQNKNVYSQNNYTNKIGSLAVQTQQFQNPVNDPSTEPIKKNVILKAPYSATTTYQPVQLKNNKQEISKLQNTNLNHNRFETKFNNLGQKTKEFKLNPCGTPDFFSKKPTADQVNNSIHFMNDKNNKPVQAKTDYGLQLVNAKPQVGVKEDSLPKKQCTSSRKRSKSNQNKKSYKPGTQSWESVFNDLFKHKTPNRGPDALEVALQNVNVGKEVTPRSTQNNTPKANQHQQVHLKSYNDQKQEKKNSINFSTEAGNTSKALDKFENKNFVAIHPKENDPFISGIPNSDYDLLDELMDDDLRQEIRELSDDDTYCPNTQTVSRLYTQTEKVNIGTSVTLIEKPAPSQISQFKAQSVEKQKVITFNKPKTVTKTVKNNVEEKLISSQIPQLRKETIEKQNIFPINNPKGVTQTGKVNVKPVSSQLKAETIGKQKIVTMNIPKSVIIKSNQKPSTIALSNKSNFISNESINTPMTTNKVTINKEHTKSEHCVNNVSINSQLMTESSDRVVTHTDKYKSASKFVKSNEPTSLSHSIMDSAQFSSVSESKTFLEAPPPIFSISHSLVQPSFNSNKFHTKSLLPVLQANNLKDMAPNPLKITATTESDNSVLNSSDFLSKSVKTLPRLGTPSVGLLNNVHIPKNGSPIAQNTVIMTATTGVPIAQDLIPLKGDFAYHLPPPLSKQPFSTNSCKLTYPTVLGSTVIVKDLSIETRTDNNESRESNIKHNKEGSDVEQNQLGINKSVIVSQVQKSKTTTANVKSSSDNQLPVNSCLSKTSPKDNSHPNNDQNDQKILCQMDQKLSIGPKEKSEISNGNVQHNNIQKEIERIRRKRLSILNRPTEQHTALSPIPLPYKSINDLKTTEAKKQEEKIEYEEYSVRNALSECRSAFVTKTAEEEEKGEIEKPIINSKVNDTYSDGIIPLNENTTQEIEVMKMPTIKSTLVTDCVSVVSIPHAEIKEQKEINKPEIESTPVKDTNGDGTSQLDENKETTIKSKTPDSKINCNEGESKNDDTKVLTLLKPLNNLEPVNNDTISFVELPRKPNDDPTKRKIRIKANGTTIAATICGNLDINIDSMFSDPEIKNLVLQNSVTKTACRINVKQRTITEKTKSETKTIVNTILYPPDVRSVNPEVIDLVSEDESEGMDDVVFKTEFGDFMSTCRENENYLKHQTRLSQKCTVCISRCDFLEKIMASKSVSQKSKTLDNGYRTNKRNADVIEIDDSSNDSIIEMNKLHPTNSYLQSNLITDLDVLRSSIIKGLKNNEFFEKNGFINEINKIESKKSKHVTYTRRGKKYNEHMRSIKTKHFKLKKCFVRLIRCDLNHQNSDFSQDKNEKAITSCKTDLSDHGDSFTLSKESQVNNDTICISHKIDQQNLIDKKSLEVDNQELLNTSGSEKDSTVLIKTQNNCTRKTTPTVDSTSSLLPLEELPLTEDSGVSEDKVVNQKCSSVEPLLTNELPSATRNLEPLSNTEEICTVEENNLCYHQNEQSSSSSRPLSEVSFNEENYQKEGMTNVDADEFVTNFCSDDAPTVSVEEIRRSPSILECHSPFSIIKDYTVNRETNPLLPQTWCCAEWYVTKRYLNIQYCDLRRRNKLIENNNKQNDNYNGYDVGKTCKKQCNNNSVLSLLTIMTNYVVNNSAIIDISSPVIPQFYKYCNRKRRMIKTDPTSDNIMKQKCVLKKFKHMEPIPNCPVDIGKENVEKIQATCNKYNTVNYNIVGDQQPIKYNKYPVIDKQSIEEFLHNEKMLYSKFEVSKCAVVYANNSDSVYKKRNNEESLKRLNNIAKSKQGYDVKLDHICKRKHISLNSKINSNDNDLGTTKYSEVTVEKPTPLNLNGNRSTKPSDTSKKKNITLLYKRDDSDIILEGSVYKDPVIGTCYLFPIHRSIKNDIKAISDGEVESIVKIKNVPIDASIFESNFNVLIPKVTYSRQGLITDLYLKTRRNLKRKSDFLDYKYSSEKRYRKGKNINYPKTHASVSNHFAYIKEFKALFNYWESIKFSFSRPYHKENLDVHELHESWPVQGAINLHPHTSENDNDFFLYHGEPYSEYDPLRQTLAEEIASEGYVSEYKSIEIDEINFSMGFGEGSDRVIQQYGDQNTPQDTSAATLSDVKPQPFSGSEYSNIELKNSVKFQTHKDDIEVTKRFLNYIKQKNKVRSFFKQTNVELNLEWMSCVKENGKKCKQYFDGLNPFEVHSYDFFTVPSIETIVQVVQVGQLPVSAAAQNPVTCDPRVTQVTDASPPQCSAENSPRDGSQPSVKTEYTELTTADLSLPLVEEYERQNKQTISYLSQTENNKLTFSDENIPIEKEVNSIVKIEIAEESLENEEVDNEDSELQKIISQHTNNREFCFTNDSGAVTESQVLSFQNLNDTEPFLQNEERNEKTDQIAHAMSAAGITTSSEQLLRSESQTIENVRRDKINEDTSSLSLTSGTYPKAASINAISLQQALAQILPPPLNRTNSSDSNQSTSNPQVLHLVGKNSSSVNQLTLMDNTQQSLLNASNSTPVLHIVQNKGQANNNNTGHSTNSFNGLVDSNNLQQGSSQLLHIVNTSGQKTNNTGQLLKRVNLLTNLSNVQSGNEQKMVQFVCKSADGKSIQLNAPHQRSMVLRIQPIESTNVQSTKPAESHNDGSTNGNSLHTNSASENTSSQQEIKSRSVYEENYAKFIQNSGKSTITEKNTSLPKFNQAFGKQVFQDENQKVNITENHSHLTAVNSANEVTECQNDNSISLDQIGHLSNPPLLLRKATPQATSQTQSTQQSLVTQLKQTITPMNLQTMHGGVIYTRQIPVNIGGGQTINLITVPSTELIDDSNQKQSNNSSDGEPSIIKIVSQNSTPNSEVTPDESRGHGSTDTSNHQPQPVLTQMRIKLPMLSKPSQMVSGARVVRPSFFQIQRNVIGGVNQPVYQQLVLTAAPSLGQQTIRLPQSQTNRLIKVPAENPTTSESQMSSSTLEQLREFDMVLEQVKERSTVQPNHPSSSNVFNKVHTPSTETTDTSSHSTSSTESTHQVLYTIGNNSSLNVAYVNRKATVNPPTVTTYVRSPDSSNINDSPASSTPTQVSHTVTTESQQNNELSSSQNQHKVSKISSKSKSRPKPTPNPSGSVKINTVPPKPSTQKPFEDEQTTQRILYILAEYKEQVENSPDKDKPAPRRRSNPPSNPGSSKRKKSSSGSRRPGTRDMSPVHGEDTCRTMGSEDSSCGTSQGDCTESCLDSHSPQDSPRKVARKLSFEPETPPAQPRPQPQRNVIVADGQTITVARNNTGKPTTAVLMPANYILPVSMVKSGQQIAIVTNRGPKILTVGGGEGGGNTVLLQRLIGPGLKPVLTRPGVRHVRLPAAALQNLQAFTLGSTAGQQPDSTASVVHPNPPELIDTRATSSPWAEREGQDPKPEKQSSPGSTEPWNLASNEPHDYSYEEIVRSDNMDRTVLDAIPDRYSPEMEAQRIFDKMFDIDSKKSYIVDSQDDSPRCGYDIDASDCDDKPFHQVVHRKDGTTQRHHRLAHVSSAALRHRYAILEHELRLQKSLSEECEDLGVDSPSASELFPEAELLFSSSPAHEAPHHSHTPQPMMNQGTIPQPDMDDQIATDQLISHNDVPDEEDLNMALGLDNIVTVSADGTITLDPQEFARSHPNTTFHKEPTDESELQPFTIANVKGRHMTSTIFHASRAPATVLVTAPQTTVISQAAPDGGIQNNHNLKYSDTPSNSQQGSIPSVLVKDNGVSKFDSMLNRELHLSNTASTIIHSGATQVIRRVCYDDDKHDPRFLESHALMGEDAKMAEDSRDATLESMVDVDDDRSSPERNEMFWESNSTSERSEGRRPLDFSSDSDKCCKSPFEETNSTDSSGIGTHIMRLDSVIKDARGIERSGSADGSSADDTHPPLRTYPPKRYHPPDAEERSTSGKTRAGERSPDSMESRRRASNRGVVKRGCHCCNGSPAPSKPKKSRPRKPNTEFTT